MKTFSIKKVSILATIVVMLFSTVIPASATSGAIYPGPVWQDTSGGIIESHGGGLLKVGSTYYWYGEDHTNGYYFQNINVYSSTDLVNWTFAGHALSQSGTGDLGPNRVVERPKVIYNSTTKKYVLFMHIDNSNYSEAKVGIATAASPTGPFTYIGSSNPNGHQSRDMTIFQDTNGSAYLVALGEDAAGSINQNDRIFPLTSDYLGFNPEVYTFVNAGREGLAVFKAGSYYFIVSSACTGWNPNQQKYTSSTSMTSGWSTTWTNLGDSTGYTSQTNYILPVSGSSTTSYMYMGDRWNSSNLADSRYIWLPLTVSNNTLTLNFYDTVNVDASTGVISGTNNVFSPTVNYKLVGKQSNKLLEVYNSSIADGGNVDIWTDNGANNQKWNIVAVGGYYKLINVNSGKALDVVGQGTADGTKVDQWTYNGGNNQLWSIVNVGGFKKLIARNSGKALDVIGQATADGTNVDQWTDNGGANQQWLITK